MFRQIKIQESDQKYHKIIWRDHPDQPLREYQLTTVTYGTKSAPFLAMMTLKQLAIDEKSKYLTTSAANVLEDCFYMDDLDLNTVDLEEFGKENAFIAGLRLVNRTVQPVKGWKTHSGETQKIKPGKPRYIKAESALLLDAIKLYVNALYTINDYNKHKPRFLSCDAEDKCKSMGQNIVSHLKSSSWDGMTGKIEFNSQGIRSQLSLDLIQLTTEGFTEVGTWNSTTGLQCSVRHCKNKRETENIMKNKHMIVTTIMVSVLLPVLPVRP
ncbi:hypothetical protein ACJJTC_015796 [Scirpophaga incertulas]